MNIAIIPARFGSKRIKKKNLKSFYGKPIIYYSIKAASKAKIFDKIIVSTDNTKIKKISENFGAEVPFIRPKKLSGDKTKAQDVIIHAIKFLVRNKIKFTNVCCIYPTAALIQPNNIKKGLKKLNDGWKYVFSACAFEKSVLRSFKINKDKRVKFLNPNYINTNTQDLQKTYFDAGQFYWARKNDWLKKNLYLLKGSIVELDSKYVQDLDYKKDFKLLKSKYKKLNKK
tara:strand:+ start:214 stop:897 length:684 start_codon:yes stop_codon:yes gene_type:complete